VIDRVVDRVVDRVIDRVIERVIELGLYRDARYVIEIRHRDTTHALTWSCSCSRH
jgi:hypothetical protein